MDLQYLYIFSSLRRGGARLLAAAVLLSATLALASCLDEDPKGRIPEDEAYTTADDIERNLVATLYNYIGGNADSQGLQGTFRGVYDWNSMTTDEQMLPVRGGDWYDGGFWQRLYHHTWTTTDDALDDTWNYLYKVVVLCNRSLDLIERHRDVLSNTQYRAYTAEVRAVRAMFHFYLMDLFGRIPYVTDYNIRPDEATQAERSVSFRAIVADLQESLPYLPDGRSNTEGATYGRLTQPVALFLLAKLALNAEIYADDNWTDGTHPDGRNIFFDVGGQRLDAWQTATAYCDSIADGRWGYALEDNPAANFAIHNETSRENIFTIPMDKMLYSNQFGYLFRSRHYAHGAAIGLDAENGTTATRQAITAFGYGTGMPDSRLSLCFYTDTVRIGGSVVTTDDGRPLVYQPLEVRPDLTGSPFEKTAGARMKKYEVDPTAYADGKLQDNDIVLFRFADVLLMRAEALTREGLDGTADLNKIRRRAHAPLLAHATLADILDERLLELMWEGWRRNDLVRFRLFTASYDFKPSDPDSHTTVFPIPDKAVKLSGGTLTQNPGYD